MQMTCPCCGDKAFYSLPDPHPTQSMASDFRIVPHPLSKAECATCGLVKRSGAPAVAFDEKYALYAHAPGRAEELHRQSLYAGWIATLIPEPESVNGSLLLALRSVWHSTRFGGTEPANGAAESARNAGLAIETGFLRGGSAQSDLALTVNVLEHVPNPGEFAEALASHTSRDVIVIVPDGSRPNVELLIGDHLHSFSPTHVRVLLNNAGLVTLKQVSAPPALGAFFATVATRKGVPPLSLPKRERPDRRRYLHAWQWLDNALLMRLPDKRIDCFGAGEAAALLRAYAPKTWARIESCFVDNPSGPQFGTLAVGSLDSTPRCLLLGVRPQAQPPLAERLERAGHETIRWDDLVTL